MMLSTLHVDNNTVFEHVIDKRKPDKSSRWYSSRYSHNNLSIVHSLSSKGIRLNFISFLLLFLLLISSYHPRICVTAEMFPDNMTSMLPEESNIIVVKLDQDHCHKANSIAKRHGYINHGNVVHDCTFEFEHIHSHERRKREAIESLGSDLRVHLLEKQRVLKRVKRQAVGPTYTMEIPSTVVTTPFQPRFPVPRLPFPDPMYNDQWYLTGIRPAPQNGRGADMGVVEAWQMGFAGRGVVTSILDDGILSTHPDLRDNYDAIASTDINGRDADPTPQNNGDNKHGTRCAGEVSAIAGNNVCGVGIAYLSKVGGVRMLDGTVTDSVEARSLGHAQDHIDIYSASWGPEDDGKTFDGPGPLAKEAFYKGITHGRGGKGNIFIWASGNGGSHEDSCSADGYTTSIFTLSVSSATFDNHQPWYLEECPSSIATTYSSAGLGQPAIVTVDMPGGCTKSHTGTSASAPIAAGIVALALEANPRLTWRDIQHLVLRTSDAAPLMDNPGWIKNAVGRLVSNKFGYGLMHAGRLVKAALKWTGVPEQHICTYDYHMEDGPFSLQGKFTKNFSLPVASCAGTDHAVNYLEHVHLVISVNFNRRGALKISLTSPQGTTAVLLPPRRNDNNKAGFHKWPFLSVHHWGESPAGVWNLTIENAGSGTESGKINDWSLILYGTSTPPDVGSELEYPMGHGMSAQSATGSGAMSGIGADRGLTPAITIQSLGHQVRDSARQAGQIDDPEDEPNKSHSGSAAASSKKDGVNGKSPETGDFQGGDGASASSSTDVIGDGPGRAYTKGCHLECTEDGCFEPNSASACSKCRNFKINKRNRAGFKCVARCNVGFYADVSSKTCRHCLMGCESCSSGESCDACRDGLFLIRIDADENHPRHGKCDQSLRNRTGGQNCPEGFIESRSTNGRFGICSWKPKFREEISHPKQMLPPSTKVEPRCYDSHCTQYACQNGQYCNHFKRCCDCFSDCMQCKGPNVNDCTDCPLGKYMQDGACVIECGQGTFHDDKRCIACSADCEACVRSNKTFCTACWKNFYLVPNSGHCIECDTTCDGCRGSGPAKCKQCAANHIIDEVSQQCRMDMSRTGLSHLAMVTIILCVLAGGVGLIVFICLMIRDRRTSSYRYQQILQPGNLSLGKKNGFGIADDDGIVSDASASDMDDVIFTGDDTSYMIRR